MLPLEQVPVPALAPQGSTSEERTKARRERRRAEKINAELHSERASMQLKLDVAAAYRDEEQIFYPHNVDFRGRAYPMHAHLHHLGADASRGMLEFAKARPLGSRGLFWLKVHLANLVGAGVDKLSFADRGDFVDTHWAEIVDSAESPLEGRRWWLQAEDPFQCLAACRELAAAVSSRAPELYCSRLPVHQDGSCNGLQHYAALGRDEDGASSVNMTNIKRPADVYTRIADM